LARQLKDQRKNPLKAQCTEQLAEQLRKSLTKRQTKKIPGYPRMLRSKKTLASQGFFGR